METYFFNNYRDDSPHRQGFITVNGVKLHYLDWGGSGEPLLLLAGMGCTAHIFDHFAPKFTDRFHVLGLTRRGHGQSDKPATGYDTATLVEDIRGFLDAMYIGRVTLVGFSLAGDELTMFAGKYPERVAKLVYLDAAYDHSSTGPIDEKLGPLMIPWPTHDNDAFEALKARLRKSLRAEPLEAEIHACYLRHPDGRLEEVIPEYVCEALRQGMQPNPDYAKVRAPTLNIYTDDIWPESISVDNREKAKPVLGEVQEWRDTCRDDFQKGMPHAHVIKMPDTSHFCFIQREAAVVREMRAFLLEG